MAKRRLFEGVRVAVDSISPWKMTQRNYKWPSGYKMSVSEWQALLARAKRGDSEAEWGVADRYGDGCKDTQGKVVVRRSARRAAEWFRRAAEHGSAPAQNNLGVLLGNGDGVPKDVPEALFWLRKAFYGGDTCAASNVAVTYREVGNLRMAVRWFRKCATAGDDDALVQLGIHYFWGKGVRRNPKAAVQCFRKATKGKNICEFGRDDAFFYLGVAYFEGRGVKKSIPTAIRLFHRANVDNDNPAARRMLAPLVPQNGARDEKQILPPRT